jgi:hypothetical protein
MSTSELIHVCGLISLYLEFSTQTDFEHRFSEKHFHSDVTVTPDTT